MSVPADVCLDADESQGTDHLEQESSSGFSFLSSAGAEERVQEPAEFGFSFMNSADPAEESTPSGFGFMSSATPIESSSATANGLDVNVNSSATTPEILSNTNTSSSVQDKPATQEIKLAKVSTTKPVKKKKRAPKVGYAREEDREVQEDSNAVNTPPEPPREKTYMEKREESMNASRMIGSGIVVDLPEPVPAVSEPEPDNVVAVESTEDVAPPTSVSDPVPVSRPLNREASTDSIVSDRSTDGDSVPPVTSAPPGRSAQRQGTRENKSKRKSGGGFMSTIMGRFHKSADGASPSAETPVVESPAATNSVARPTLQKPAIRTPTPPSPSPASGPPSTNRDEGAAGVTQSYNVDMFMGMSTSSAPTPSTPPTPTTQSTRSPTTQPPRSPKTQPSLPSTTSTPPSSTTNAITEKISPAAASATVSSATPSPPSPTPVAKKKAPPEDDAAVCLRIKDLAVDVMTSFENTAREQSMEQARLMDEGQRLRLELEKEEVAGRLLRQRADEVEEEQGRLAEAEDFESADALSVKLELLRDDIKKSAERVVSLSAQITAADEGLDKSRREQATLLEATIKGLSNLRRQQQEEVEKYSRSHRKRLSAEEARVKAEEERVNMERSGVAREEAALDEEKREIEAVIMSQTEEVQASKEEMELRLMGVTAEIRSLEKALAEKRQQEKDLKSDLAVVETKIGEVRKKYDRRLQRIHERVVDLNSDSQACKREEDAIQQMRLSYEADRDKFAKTEADIDRWLESVQSEIDVASELRSTLDFVRKPVAATKDPEAEAALVTLKQSVVKADAALNNSITALRGVHDKIGQLTDEDSDITEKIPILESEKKAHATNKRFKEAAAVAKTLKSMMSRKDEIAEFLQSSAGELAAAEANVELAKSELDDSRSQLREAEKGADIVRFNGLLLHAKELLKSCRKAEKAAATTDDGDSTTGTLTRLAHSLLDAELQAVLAAASEIKAKHDLPDSLDFEGESEYDETHNTAEIDEGDHAPLESTEDDLVAEESVEVCEEVVDRNDAADLTESGDGDSSSARNEDDAQPVTEDIADVQSVEDNRAQDIHRAKDLIATLDQKEAELEAAVDAEEYDDAADLSEQVDDIKKELQSVFLKYNISRDEVLAEAELENNAEQSPVETTEDAVPQSDDESADVN